MIVVIGLLEASAGRPPRPAGTAASVALIVAQQGAAVQFIGKIGDDEPGDAVLGALARSGVGHAAVLRDPTRRTPLRLGDDTPRDPFADEPRSAASDREVDGESPVLEPADVDLGLRYFTEFRVVVAAEPLSEPVRRVVIDASRYAGAALILVASAGDRPGDPLPKGTIVLEQPTGASGDGFATFLGDVAAAIDAGRTPEEALNMAAAAVGAVRPSAG